MFTRVPQSQHIDSGFLNFISQFIISNKNLPNLARFELKQLFTNAWIH
jgi:hypothetical protein